MDRIRRKLITSGVGGFLAGSFAPQTLSNAILAREMRGPVVKIVVNDLFPTFMPSAMPYRILSCKDLVGIRNTFVGYTTESVLASSEIDALYARVRAAHLAQHNKTLADITKLDADLAAADREVRKEEVDLAIGGAFAVGAIVAGLLAASWPVIGLIATTTVSVVQLSYYTVQLFQIEDENHAVDVVVSFNDSKMSALSLMAKRMKDSSSSQALDRINARSWGLLSLMLTISSVYTWYTGRERRERLKELVAVAKRDYQSMKIDIDQVLKSKQEFVEYIRVVSAQGAATTEKLWRAASLNQCSLAGTLKLSTLLQQSPNTSVLRSLP